MMIFIFVLTFIIGIAVGSILIWNFMEKVVLSVEKISEKHAALFRLMNNWTRNYQNKKNISEYLKNNGISTVAIYGLGDVGETLYNELNATDVQILYGIDQSVDYFCNIPIYKKNDLIPEVDLIIVTAITAYKDIEVELSKKIRCKIISIEELVLMI